MEKEIQLQLIKIGFGILLWDYKDEFMKCIKEKKLPLSVNELDPSKLDDKTKKRLIELGMGV